MCLSNLSTTNIGLYIGLYLRSHKYCLWMSTKMETKGICLCKQDMNMEDSSKTIIRTIVSTQNRYTQSCHADPLYTELCVKLRVELYIGLMHVEPLYSIITFN